MMRVAVADFLGKVFSSITKSDDELIFFVDGVATYKMYHSQDCCEHVYLEDVIGDLDDLIGAPLHEAEEVSNNDDEPLSEHEESYTWTFYKLGTSKGYVTLRWYGSSNGYYSESVDIEDLTRN
jgi:hypothetical protein